MNSKHSVSIFIKRLQAYDLKISKINGESCDDIPSDLCDRIFSEDSVDLTFNIDNQSYNIKIAADEDTALVVYDYHEVFDIISADIRNYQSFIV